MTTVSAAYQTALPSLVRKNLRIKKGDRIIWEVDVASDRVYVKAAPVDWVAYLRGAGRGVYGNPETYVKTLRNQWRRS